MSTVQKEQSYCKTWLIPSKRFPSKTFLSRGTSIQNPGQWESMQPVAQGTWKVIYAPHMTTMAALIGGGSFDVSYVMQSDGTMTSHAVCNFPWLPNGKVILSVSGTWGSVSSHVCRVDFDRLGSLWIETNRLPSLTMCQRVAAKTSFRFWVVSFSLSKSPSFLYHTWTMISLSLILNYLVLEYVQERFLIVLIRRVHFFTPVLY